MTDSTPWLPTAEAASRYVDVGGSRMHYVDAGAGEPVVFLHGNPTSSYLWRQVIPHLTPHARCIAPDLIGMGYSDKPAIGYRFSEHYRYLRAFLDRLGLERVVFVGHDWGGSLAFRCLAEAPERVRGLAFMEVMLAALSWREMPWDFRLGFPLMRAPGVGWLMLSVANAFVNLVLPAAAKQRLPAEVMRQYRAPLATIGSRRAVRQWPREVPLNGRPADNAATFRDCTQALCASPIPKLLCYTQPGAVVGTRRVAWARQQLPNLELAYMGAGIHFMPEEHPHGVGAAIADWYRRHWGD